MSEATKGYLLFKSSQVSGVTVETGGVILAQFLPWLDADPDVSEIDTGAIRQYLDFHKERGRWCYSYSTSVRARAR